MGGSFEAQVVQLDQALAEAEKHVAGLLSRVCGLRKRPATGEFSAVQALFEPMPRLIEQVAGSVEAVRGALTYDTAAALADGDYQRELEAEAKAQDLVLIERN